MMNYSAAVRGGAGRPSSAPGCLTSTPDTLQDSPVPNEVLEGLKVTKIQSVTPTKYLTPEEWLAAAKKELPVNLSQASEKLYMAGRKALDRLAQKAMVSLRSHEAADEFVNFLESERICDTHFVDLWFTKVNLAHSNFYDERLSEKILGRMFPKVEEFMQLSGAIKLMWGHQKKFEAWVDNPRQRLNSRMQHNHVLAVWGP